MAWARCCVLALILANLNVLVLKAEDVDGEDSPSPGSQTPPDQDTDEWSFPGVGPTRQAGSEDLSDEVLEESMDSMLETPGMAGMLNMFKNMGPVMANMRRSQNGNQRGNLNPGGRNLPWQVRNNPCFSNTEKMQELNEEMRSLMTGSGTEEHTDSIEDYADEVGDVIEKISETSLECFTPMINNNTKMQICQKFSRRSVSGFQKLLSAGLDCVEILSFSNDTDDDDDDDDDLDLAHQMSIMNHMQRQRPIAKWSRVDIDRAFRLAPETVDDDVIEGLSDEVFEQSLQDIGRRVMRRRGNPSMQAALRQRITRWKSPKTMSAADITGMGAGLAALDTDDLDDLDPEELSNADLSKVDLDFDDDDPRGLALGRLMRQGAQRNPSQFTTTDINQMFRFMKSDTQFIRNLDVDELVKSLSGISQLDLDDDEARPLCRKIRQSADWDEDGDITLDKLRQLGPIIAGCGKDFLDDLPSNLVQGALPSIKDLDFDDSEAESLIEKLNFGSFKAMTPSKFRQLGKLAKALKSDDIDDLPDSVVSDVLDDLNDIDMDDWKKKKFVYKAIAGNGNRLPAKLLIMKGLANSLSLDDLDDVDVEDIKKNIIKVRNINWRKSLASAVYHKLRTVNPNFNVDDLGDLGNLVTGMSNGDIDELPDDKVNVLKLASALADHHDDLSDTQTEAVSRKIQKAYRFDQDSVDMDENDVMQAAPFLQYLPGNLFNKIRMTQPAREAFLTAMNRGSKSRISRQQLMFLTSQGQKMLSPGGTEQETDLDDQKVAKLSGLLAGMPDHVIRRLPGQALVRNIRGFTRKPLSAAQGQAVMQKVMQHDTNWHCKRERLAQVGPFLKHLSEDKMKTICKSEMAAAASAVIKGMNRDDTMREERRKQGFTREEVVESMTKDGEERVINYIRESLSSDSSSTTRRRRALGDLTCDQVKTFGEKASMLAVSSLQQLDTTVEMANCLATLGSVSTWNSDQLKVLLEKTKTVYGGPNTWTSEIVRQAGSILAALTPDELSAINLTTVDAIASAGKHKLFTSEQLRAGFYRWLSQTKTNDISTVTAEELSSLGHFICGPKPEHISLISVTAFKGALNVIGGAVSCDANQLRAFGARATTIYGNNVASWNVSIIVDIGVVIGGLQASQITMLTSEQIAVISPAVIPSFHPDVLKSFTTTQLGHFSANQANAITQEQYNHLPAAKQKVITSKASIAFQTDGPGGTGDATQTRVAFVSISMVVICQMFLLN